MIRFKKAIRYISFGVMVLILPVLVVGLIRNYQITLRIPEVPANKIHNTFVKQQIFDKYNKARKRPTADNLGSLAMVYHSCANYTIAEQCYKLAINRKSDEWVWIYYLGYLEMEMGKSESAIENFRKVSQLNPDIQIAWYYLGKEYINTGQTEMAKKSFQKLLNITKKKSISNKHVRTDHFALSTYSKFQLARIYINNSQIDLAEKMLVEIIEKDDFFGPAYRLLGTIYNRKGDSSLGRKYTEHANDLLVFSPPVDTMADKLTLLSRSELYLLKKIDEAEKSVYSNWAITLVEHALKYLPENQDLLLKAIRIYLWNKMYDQASSISDSYLNMIKSNLFMLKKVGMLFYKHQLYSEAKKYWLVALDIKPNDIEIQKELAICFWSTGEKNESLSLLTKIYENNPDKADVLAEINYLMYLFGQKEKATKQLTKLKQISPINPKVLQLSAEIAKDQGNIFVAINIYKSLVEEYHELETINILGDLFYEMKMWEEYIDNYKKALGFYPDDTKLLMRLGTMYINCPDSSLRDIKTGIYYCKRAFINSKSSSETQVVAGNHLAYAYTIIGNKRMALIRINQTINIARREKMSDDIVERLEAISKQVQQLKE